MDTRPPVDMLQSRNSPIRTCRPPPLREISICLCVVPCSAAGVSQSSLLKKYCNRAPIMCHRVGEIYSTRRITCDDSHACVMPVKTRKSVSTGFKI